MFKLIQYIILTIVVLFLISCTMNRYPEESQTVDIFTDYTFGFLESFNHQTDLSKYSDMPFDLKFGGINADEEYLWLRDSNHLRIAFNTFSSIGLDQFVSVKQYNIPDDRWCCNTQWEKKSLNQVVREFLKSDTSSTLENDEEDYFFKFWNRRRTERNLRTTYDILVKIDEFYNKDIKNDAQGQIDTMLTSLLSYDLKLGVADSVSYTHVAEEYFNYLKSVKLYHSAYVLMFENPKIHLDKEKLNDLKQELIDVPISVEELKTGYDEWFNHSAYGP